MRFCYHKLIFLFDHYWQLTPKLIAVFSGEPILTFAHVRTISTPFDAERSSLTRRTNATLKQRKMIRTLKCIVLTGQNPKI